MLTYTAARTQSVLQWLLIAYVPSYNSAQLPRTVFFFNSLTYSRAKPVCVHTLPQLIDCRKHPEKLSVSGSPYSPRSLNQEEACYRGYPWGPWLCRLFWGAAVVALSAC